MYVLLVTIPPCSRVGSVYARVKETRRAGPAGARGHVCWAGERVARPGQIGPGSNNIPSSNLCQSSDQHFMRHSEDLQTVKKPVLRTESGGQ